MNLPPPGKDRVKVALVVVEVMVEAATAVVEVVTREVLGRTAVVVKVSIFHHFPSLLPGKKHFSVPLPYCL